MLANSLEYSSKRKPSEKYLSATLRSSWRWREQVKQDHISALSQRVEFPDLQAAFPMYIFLVFSWDAFFYTVTGVNGKRRVTSSSLFHACYLVFAGVHAPQTQFMCSRRGRLFPPHSFEDVSVSETQFRQMPLQQQVFCLSAPQAYIKSPWNITTIAPHSATYLSRFWATDKQFMLPYK